MLLVLGIPRVAFPQEYPGELALPTVNWSFWPFGLTTAAETLSLIWKWFNLQSFTICTAAQLSCCILNSVQKSYLCLLYFWQQSFGHCSGLMTFHKAAPVCSTTSRYCKA